MTTLAPGDARSRLEMAVELLRREWRDGCPAGMAYQTALGSVRRLRPVAASEQIADDLSRIIEDLDAYTTLSPRAPSGRADGDRQRDQAAHPGGCQARGGRLVR